MRPSSLSGNDDGSAALEFMVVGLLLLVPLVYLVVTLGLLQEQTLGAEAAARHTARVVAQAPDAKTAAARADAVLDSVIREYGMKADSVDLTVSCVEPVGSCPQPGATIVVTVNTSVALPFLPPLPGLERAAAIPVEAQAAQKVSRLWGSGG